MPEVIIHDGNYQQFIEHAGPDSLNRRTGLIPRNYETHPIGYCMYAKPFDLPLIDPSEYQTRMDDKVVNKELLSDIRNTGMYGQRIPSRDQNGKGYCTPPGTLIRMADGSQKRIENVKMFDSVLSGNGNVRRVMQLHAREYQGEMTTVKAYGHSHLRLTPNHRVMTKRGYVPAGELTTNDWIVAPKYAPQDATVIQTATHLQSLRTRVGATVSIGVSGRTLKSVPDFIQLNKATGRIFGLWLAEGSCRGKTSGGLIWSFGTEKKSHLVSELVNLLKSEWGVDAVVSEGHAPSVTNVIVYGKLWQELFTSLLGRRAEGKRLHPDLTSGPDEFLSGLFWSWMDADGCRRITAKRKQYSLFCTVSHSLALNMYDIANHLGLCPTILKEKITVNKYAASRQVPWKITVIPEPGNYRPNYRMESSEDKVWRKVYEVEREAYSGMVHNIGVETDNSYVAEGIFLSNCWAHSSTSAALIVRAANNQPYKDLSAYAVACIIKGYRDEGGWGAESLEWIAKNGIPTSTTWPQQSMSRSNDSPAMRADASLNKFTEWMDLDPNNMKAQLITCLLLGLPVVSDFNWWSHSVCTLDLVSLNPFRTRIWNSWGDSWSEGGTGILEGSKAMPDSALAARVMSAS